MDSPDLRLGSRIAIIGGSGSGKTTLARQLAERLGFRHIEIDGFQHGPDWSQTPAADLRRLIAEQTAADGWVCDGNYMAALGDLVLHRAETVIWLDYPLPVALWRLLRRTLRRISTREELWNGNRESWRGAFIGADALFPYAVKAHLRRRQSWPPRLAAAEKAGVQVLHHRSPAETQRVLRPIIGGNPPRL